MNQFLAMFLVIIIQFKATMQYSKLQKSLYTFNNVCLV